MHALERKFNQQTISNHRRIRSFPQTKHIHLISCNETKLDNTDNLTMNNYNIIRKDRNSHGGGVAIIINDQLEYEQLDLFEEFNLELIAIKITLNNHKSNFITFYLPLRLNYPQSHFS